MGTERQHVLAKIHRLFVESLDSLVMTSFTPISTNPITQPNVSGLFRVDLT